MKKTILFLSLCTALYSCNNQPARQEDTSAVEKENEIHRPQFHFTPTSGWMNDPNGMVYHKGEYHLFYQHYPDSTVWGPMHWGHAVSKDLIHWEHLPIALYPDSLGTIFSGSAVVDVNNTSGLGTTDNPPMIAIFTYHSEEKAKAGRKDFQTQGMAYSLDNGRKWTKYEANPVLPNPGIPDFRDPKVSWHEASKQWVMILAVVDHVELYGSKDLKNWSKLSEFGKTYGAHGGVWECPDLFPLQVNGGQTQKWVMLVSINPGGPNGGSATQYFVGDFDGSVFVLDKQFAEGLSTKAVVPAGKIFAGFEENSYQGWQTEGEAFGKTPVQGSIGKQQKVSEFAGKGRVNSFTNGDGATGKLTSPVFTIENNYINMLVGGGRHPGRTAVNLLVDNQVVKTATGNNSESLSWTSWNTKDLKGKQARIEIVDQETGGWGHILVDQIMFADAPATGKKEGVWLDYGRDNYAGVTWANIPDNDGRRIFMGWMSNWDYANVVPTQKWRSAMTIARTLTLENTAAGLRVASRPVKELEKIRAGSYKIPAADITDTLELSQNLKFSTATLSMDLELIADSQNKGFAIELSNSKNQQIIIGFDTERNQYYVDRTKAGNHQFSASFPSISYAPRLTSGDTFSINLIVDVASLELFADGGKTVITEIFFPDEEFTRVRLISRGGKFRISSGDVYQLDAVQSRAQ